MASGGQPLNTLGTGRPAAGGGGDGGRSHDTAVARRKPLDKRHSITHKFDHATTRTHHRRPLRGCQPGRSSSSWRRKADDSGSRRLHAGDFLHAHHKRAAGARRKIKPACGSNHSGMTKNPRCDSRSRSSTTSSVMATKFLSNKAQFNVSGTCQAAEARSSSCRSARTSAATSAVGPSCTGAAIQNREDTRRLTCGDPRFAAAAATNCT